MWNHFCPFTALGNTIGLGELNGEYTFWLSSRNLMYVSSAGRRYTMAFPVFPILAVRPQRWTKLLHRSQRVAWHEHISKYKSRPWIILSEIIGNDSKMIITIRTLKSLEGHIAWPNWPQEYPLLSPWHLCTPRFHHSSYGILRKSYSLFLSCHGCWRSSYSSGFWEQRLCLFKSMPMATYMNWG